MELTPEQKWEIFKEVVTLCDTSDCDSNCPYKPLCLKDAFYNPKDATY